MISECIFIDIGSALLIQLKESTKTNQGSFKCENQGSIASVQGRILAVRYTRARSVHGLLQVHPEILTKPHLRITTPSRP